MLKLTDDIKMGMSKRLGRRPITILLQFYFVKAFNNVSPFTLLKKLTETGLSKSALL